MNRQDFSERIKQLALHKAKLELSEVLGTYRSRSDSPDTFGLSVVWKKLTDLKSTHPELAHEIQQKLDAIVSKRINHIMGKAAEVTKPSQLESLQRWILALQGLQKTTGRNFSEQIGQLEDRKARLNKQRQNL